MLRLIIFAAFSVASMAEVIDRVAVSVGKQIITAGQIDEEIRVTAFLNHEKPHFTVDEKKKAAERLIEQALIKDGMEKCHYPLPTLAAKPTRM